MIKTYDIDLDDTLVDGASKIFENLGTDIDSAIKIFLKQAILRKGFPFDVTIPEEVESGKWKAENGKRKVESEAAVGGMISAESGACAETVDSVVESENLSVDEAVPEEENLHGGISEEEEFAAATATAESVATEAPVPQVSAEIAARVAANEALVAEMRNEIGEKEVTPEFDENEDDGTYGNYEQAGEVESGKPKVESSEPLEVGEQACVEETVSVEENSCEAENLASEVENSVEAGNLSESEVAPEKKNPANASAVDEGSDDEDETTPDNLFDAWDVGDEEEVGCK